MTLSSRRARIVVAAILVFVATITLRATAASNADAVLTLNTIPVVMIAFEFGWRGGAIAAAIALAWVIAWHAITLAAGALGDTPPDRGVRPPAATPGAA